MEEIDERRAWLNDMESMGEGDRYRQQINLEIKQRVLRLKELQ
jgi:hypothetical protein